MVEVRLRRSMRDLMEEIALLWVAPFNSHRGTGVPRMTAEQLLSYNGSREVAVNLLKRYYLDEHGRVMLAIGGGTLHNVVEEAFDLRLPIRVPFPTPSSHKRGKEATGGPAPKRT